MSTCKNIKSATNSTSKSSSKKNCEVVVSDDFGGSIASIQNGLTIFSSRDQYLSAHIRNAVELLIKKSSSELGIPFPEVNEVLYLHSGNAREMQQLSALHYANDSSDTTVKDLIFEFESCSYVNWVSREGQELLFSHLAETDGVVTVAQNTLRDFSPAMVTGLNEIRRKAKRMKKIVVMFLNVSENQNAGDLASVCDDYFEVTECEPDIDCALAFAFDCNGLKFLNSLGVGKTMCNVDMSSGKIQHRYTPFIASDLETRAMWVMRRQEMTLEAIGKHFGGLHKSSVLKRLKGLPNPANYNVDTGWLKRFLDEEAD